MGELARESAREGWFATHGGEGPAHYFKGSRSMCGRWLQTTVDKPLAESPRALRCQECVDLMGLAYE